MKKILTNIFLCSLFLSFGHISAQEIDMSLLSSLSPEEIEIAKEQLIDSEVLSSEKPEPTITESTIIEVDPDKPEDINKEFGEKFGYSFFSTIPTNIAAVGDLPLPNDYKISLSDQFTVILSGSEEKIFDLDVNLDGTILFPELGSISVVGETFNDVKLKLRNLIKQSYIGVDLDLSIRNLAAKKITVVGAVKTPGTYLVNPFSTISSALAYSGGISDIGTLRKIKLIRNNGEIFYFDLYKLLINGDRSDDITIESGDVIFIEPASSFISIEGEVKRPAIYEILHGEDLQDLINYSLGFTNISNKNNISIDKLDISSSSIRSITTNNLSYDLLDAISVKVNPYMNTGIAGIEVLGAIKEPGLYGIDRYETLEDLINDLEFIDVYPWLVVLEQFDKENLIKRSIFFNLRDPNTFKSIKLLPNSKIYFANMFERVYEVDPSTSELIEDYGLKIVHKQGIFELPVVGNFSVKSFVDFLGLDMTDVEVDATYISPLENLVIQDNYMNMNFYAKKYHNVTFRSPINDLITVSISGAVDFPGTYTLSSKSTIQDLYSLTGKFKDEAFLPGIIFSRKSLRDRQLADIEKAKDDLRKGMLAEAQKGQDIDIDMIESLSTTIEPENLGRIAGNFSPASIAAKNTVLNDEDSIFVPKNPYTISVLGEVVNPISFEYTKKINIKTAVEMAGGYHEYADKKRIYVIKANGMVQRANRNIFAGDNSLEPGDSIIVPRKVAKLNPGLAALTPITQILSDLSFSAAAIQNLRK